MVLLLATKNAHKVIEIREALLQTTFSHEWTLETLADHPEVPEPPETGETFEANALQKARFVAHLTGLVCLADDSGLVVDALDGAPGVYSKRFSVSATDEGNNALLIERLNGVENRTARFVCVLALVDPDGFSRTACGTCEGVVGTWLRGTGGFGYDPLFWPAAVPGRSMAELSMDEKNAISHRGAALGHLPKLLADWRHR